MDFSSYICIIKKEQNKVGQEVRIHEEAPVKEQNRIMVETACSISKKTGSKGLVLYGDMIKDYEALAKIGQERKIDFILAIKDSISFREASLVFKKVLRVPDIPLGRINQIKMALLQGLSKGLFKNGPGFLTSGMDRPGLDQWPGDQLRCAG